MAAADELTTSADAVLRQAADRLERGPAGELADAAEDVLGKLDRLQQELDRLLTGLRSTAATLERATRPDDAGRA